jgi:ribosome-associated heat shock protein Hsp15
MARIDKYLWAVRLFKTRSLASNQVKNGKVSIDGLEVKASRNVKVGEKFSIKKNTALFTYEVLDLLEKRVGAKLVETYLKDITPVEEIEKYKLYQAAQSEYRQSGLGKPSKKDKRSIKKFRGD